MLDGQAPPRVGRQRKLRAHPFWRETAGVGAEPSFVPSFVDASSTQSVSPVFRGALRPPPLSGRPRRPAPVSRAGATPAATRRRPRPSARRRGGLRKVEGSFVREWTMMGEVESAAGWLPGTGRQAGRRPTAGTTRRREIFFGCCY